MHWRVPPNRSYLTIGIAPHSGKLLFELLEEMAIREPAFRAYLADAREGGGAALADQLASLGARLSELARSRALLEEAAVRQQRPPPRRAGCWRCPSRRCSISSAHRSRRHGCLAR